MGLKFDRTKPYGTVYGHPQVSHEQEGHLFRPDGTEYIEEKPPVQDPQRPTLTVPARQ